MPTLQSVFPLNLPDDAVRLVDTIVAAGGKPVLIGGAVRDRLLGLPVKDIDIEVFGLPLDALAAALQPVAKVHAVGKSFGILKVGYCGNEIDVSLPRRERKSGQGHRGFEVQSDPYMPFSEAASRRDFTINAIGIDLIGHQQLDPWHGIDDLRLGIIRHITDAFDEDPLRVLRACQFAARFEFTIAPETLQKCRSLRAELEFLSRERIWEELKKLLLKSRRPSLGIAALADTEALGLFSELAQAWERADSATWTLHNRILDNAAQRCRDAGLPDAARLTLLLAALCLRLAPRAEVQSVAESFLQRCGCPLFFIKEVPKLVVHAYQPFDLWLRQRHTATQDGAIRRLAALQVPMQDLCLLAMAIAVADPAQPQAAPTWLLAEATRLGVAHIPPQPLLQGRHLLAYGLKPGVAFKHILDAAYNAQLDGLFNDDVGAVEWLNKYLAGA